MPTSANSNINASVNFKNNFSLPAVVEYVSVTTTVSLPASATFFQTAAVSATVNFHNVGYFATLPASATFHELKATLTANVDFKNYNSVPASATFFQSSTHNLPVTAVFTTNNSVSATVNFQPYKSLPASAMFFQYAEHDLISSVLFKIKQDLHASVNYTVPGVANLIANVFLGSLNKFLPASVNYILAALQNFNANIQIQSSNVNKPPTYTSSFDTASLIHILQTAAASLSASVKYRVPPINEDLLATVLFASNYLMHAINTATNQLYSAPVDSTGFWHIDNLPAGNYTVMPVRQGVQFQPESIDVTLSNYNSLLYFTALNVYNIQNFSENPGALPTCYINPNDGNPCTLSIEGFLLPDVSSAAAYSDVVVIITDETLAVEFRQTLPRG